MERHSRNTLIIIIIIIIIVVEVVVIVVAVVVITYRSKTRLLLTLVGKLNLAFVLIENSAKLS